MKISDWNMNLRIRSIAYLFRRVIPACFLLTFLVGANVYSQSPGGVNTGLNIWLRADTFTNCATEGCNVTAWNDFSTTPANGSGNGAELRLAGMNFNRALDFNDDGDSILFNLPNANDMTIFMIFSTTTNMAISAGHWREEAALFSAERGLAAGTYQDFGLMIGGGRLRWFQDTNVVVINSPTTYNLGRTHLATVTRGASDGASQLFGDGISQGTGFTEVGNLNASTKVELFGNPWNQTNEGNFEGLCAEVIVYDNILTVSEIQRVQSYLAIKYGITLPHNYFNRLGAVVYDVSSFGAGIIGIAKENAHHFYQKQSRPASPTASLTVYAGSGYNGTYPAQNKTNTTAFANDAYLVMGHNNASVNFTNSFDGILNQLMARTYKVQATGNAGPVTLTFSNATFTSLASGSLYDVIVSGDQVFDSTDIRLPMTEIGSTGVFWADALFPPNATSYFAIRRRFAYAPGGLYTGLQAWYRPEVLDASGTPWANTGAANNLTRTAGTAPTKVANGLNFNPISTFATGMTKDYGASTTIAGQTIVTTVQHTGATVDNAGIMGFDQDKGLRFDGTTNRIYNGNNNDDWSRDGGSNGPFRQNGTVIAPGTSSNVLTDWSTLLVRRPATHGPEEFYLGGYFDANTRPNPNDLNIAEVAIYNDNKTSADQVAALESYFAIKYGITLPNVYRSSDITFLGAAGAKTLYTPGTHNHDIAGIGRDDIALLNQKQSRSVNSDNVITIGLGTQIAADNASHPGSFSADQTFFIWGNDNASNCWSTSEISIPTNPHGFVRVEREWKYTLHGSIPSVRVRIDTNNANFRIPALQTGSTGYQLIMDMDGNFTSGATAIPMTRTGAGIWECTLTSAQMAISPGPTGSIGYFTIGAERPRSLLKPVACPGDTLEIIGSSLITMNCMQFDNGTLPVVVPILGAGPVSSLGYRVLEDNPGTCLDSAYWILPITVFPDDYWPETCLGAALGYVMLDSLKAGELTPADISVAGKDTVYLCLGDNNVYLKRITPAPGTLSVVTVSGSGSAGTLIDQMAFTATDSTPIFVQSTNANNGHYRIIFTPSGGCANMDTVVVYIGTPTSSTFSYAGQPLCTEDVAALMPTVNPANTPGLWGSFTSNSTDLILDDTTGAIQRDQSLPGTYFVTYTPHKSTCGNPALTTVVVRDPRYGVFNYVDSICGNSLSTLPANVSLPSTPGIFEVTPTGAGVTISTSTGQVSFSNPVPGDYVITYNITSSNCVIDTTDTITVVAPPNVSFNLPAEVCKMTGTVSATAIMPAATGTFSSTVLAPTFNVSTAGVVNAAASTAGGPYPVTYSYTDPATGCSNQATEYIEVLPYVMPTVTYNPSSICVDGSVVVPSFGTPIAAGQFTSTPPMGAAFSGTSGAITPGPGLTPGNYNISFAYNEPACNTPTPVATVTISPTPNARFYIDSLLCWSEGSVPVVPVAGPVGSLQLFIGNTPVPNSSSFIFGSTIFFTAGPLSLQRDQTYIVRNIVTQGACRDTFFDSFKIYEIESADFDFLDEVYCENTSDPTPFIAGNGGGVFSSVTPGLIFDPQSGTIDLDSSFTDLNGNGVDSFIVVYTTQGPCPDSTRDTVQIKLGYDSYFQYRLSTICSTRDTMSPGLVITTDPAYSRFIQTGGPAITLDPVTGFISGLNANGNINGTVTVEITHETGDSSLCHDVTVQAIQISKFDQNFSIAYVPDSVCGTGFIVPITSGDTTNAYMNNPIGITYADDELGLGVIAAEYSFVGPHVMWMTNQGVCGERDSAFLYIRPVDTASFEYNSPGVCTGDSFFVPDTNSIVTPGGVFSYRPALSNGFLALDTVTGIIDVANSSSDANFWVYYRTKGDCPAIDSQYVSINPSPEITRLYAEPSSSACIGDSINFFCEANGSISWMVNGTLTTRTGPTYMRSDLVNGSVVTAILRNSAGCTDTASILVEILPPPTMVVIDRPAVITEADPFQLQIGVGQNGTIVIWEAEGFGVDIGMSSDTTDTLMLNDIQDLPNTIKLFSDFDPGTIVYHFTPITNGCRGETDSITILVNPNTLPVFIPEVMTPNGDGRNDVWEIRYDSDIDPASYIIEVFNRSGGKEYTLLRLDEQWNGGSLPDGVYWWILKDNTGEMQQSGGLTIRRR